MLKRLRTSRGFGVHSPLAFELITDVLCSRRLRYYASAGLPSAAARRWLRVLVRFAPKGVSLNGEMPRGMTEAIAAAGASCDPAAQEFAIFATAPERLPERGVTLILDAPQEEFRRLTEGLPGGFMTFSGRREHYVVARPDLPRQHFNVWLR